MCQSRLHTASETFVHHKKIGPGSIFCVFASVASILIGKDDEYEPPPPPPKKRIWKFWTQCAITFSLSPVCETRPWCQNLIENWQDLYLCLCLWESCDFVSWGGDEQLNHVWCCYQKDTWDPITKTNYSTLTHGHSGCLGPIVFLSITL